MYTIEYYFQYKGCPGIKIMYIIFRPQYFKTLNPMPQNTLNIGILSLCKGPSTQILSIFQIVSFMIVCFVLKYWV